MNLVNRAKNILVQPKAEWPVIAAEPASVGGLFTGYAALMALLPVIGSILAGILFSPILGSSYFLASAVVGYVVGLAILFLMILAADALAPSFEGRKDQVAAAKLLIYSATPLWVAGFLVFIPAVGPLLGLAAFVYAAYLIYQGATPVMGVPEGKLAGFTAVVVILWIILSFVIGGAVMGMLMAPLLATGAPAYIP